MKWPRNPLERVSIFSIFDCSYRYREWNKDVNNVNFIPHYDRPRDIQWVGNVVLLYLPTCGYMRGIGFFLLWSFFQSDSRSLSFLSTKLLLDNLHHVIQYFLFDSSLWLTYCQHRLEGYSFISMLSIFNTQTPTKPRRFIVLFIVCNKRFIWRRPIIGIIDDWCSTYQFWNSSSLILCLKYRFLLHILLYLLIFLLFIVSDHYYFGSVIERRFS